MLTTLILMLRTLLTRCPAAGRGVVRRGFGTYWQQTQRIPVEIDRPGSRRSEGTTLRRFLGRALLVPMLLTLFTAQAQAYNTDNTARIDATFGTTPTFAISNTVTVETFQPPTQAVVELLRYQANPAGIVIPATEYSDDGNSTGNFTTITPIPGPGDLTTADAYSDHELSIIRLTDEDRNTDPAVINVIQLTLNSTSTGDYELLELRETGPDTGIFLGYLLLDKSSPVSFGGRLTVAVQDLVSVDYLDPINADTASDSTSVDPYGFVFDGLSGAPQDGLEVVLIDNATGVEATNVRGDDGAPYPGRVTTGSSFTSGALTYNFPPGGYRFPFIPTGSYSLQVITPGNYGFPSSNDTPAGAYVVLVPESYGGDFAVSTGEAIRIDIPVDPIIPSVTLWQQLSSSRKVAGPGDFVPFLASVENTDPELSVEGVIMTQVLPVGFKYQSGSVRMSGAAIADPTVGPDGLTLSFSIGSMSAGEVKSIDFIAAAATAAPGKHSSTARATDTPGDLSNQAEVTILILDELFTSRAFLVGRVVQRDECGNPMSDIGVPGVRLFLEDGTFVITDQEGRYHIEGLKPGTHVAQLDPITIPQHLKPVLCDDNTRFANTPTSRFVDLQGGTLWQADFYLAAKTIPGEVSVVLNNHFAKGDTAVYSVKASGKAGALHNLQLEIILPEGISYLPGSALNGETPLNDPQISGKQLSFKLDNQNDTWTQTLSIHTLVDSNVVTREMRARARLKFDTESSVGLVTPKSESTLIWATYGERERVEEFLLRPLFASVKAELDPADILRLHKIAERLKKLDILQIIVSGNTDSRKIRVRPEVPYLNNAELSEARARAISDILAAELQIAPEKIVVIGNGAAVPIADNRTEKGRALNRRTELQVVYQIPKPLSVMSVKSQNGTTQTIPTLVTAQDPALPAETELKTGILSQHDGERFAFSVDAVRVRLDAKLKPQLFLDGKEIPAQQIGFSLQEEETDTQLLSYIGVDFGEPGTHILQLKGIGPFGNTRFEQSVKILRTGAIARIEVADGPDNLADGRTPVRIKLNLYDAAGERIEAVSKLELRRGSLIPYLSEEHRLPRTPETSMVSVDVNGIAEFDPVNLSGTYPVTLGFGESETEIDIHVKPEQREWILVGLGERTIGQNNISGNMQTLPEGVDEDFYSDGRLAFFARGQIKGEWLLTVAYDSAKENLENRSLHQIIDPNRYYTLYGDSTGQDYAADSSKKLYVRIEKDRFYAVFGDFETGLTTTELSRYSRSLTGLKSEYAGDKYGYNAFASETQQAFVRDEIRGDGTSGLYHLTHNNIIINSEKIVIEVRDRYHSEKIIESRSLQQYIDYNIDYDDGSLYFKKPIVNRDENFNPVYIVADYETFNNTSSDYNYGGRAYLRTPDQKGEVGASLIHEGVAGADGDLYGADASWQLSPTTSVRGEFATSKKTTGTETAEGNAWLTEVQHTTPRYDARAYYREQQTGFGLGQQNASETGTRKYGADSTWRQSPKLSFSGETFRQDNLQTNANRTVATANVTYTEPKYSLTGGLNHATDNLSSGEQKTSNQASVGADWHATNKLTLKAHHEQSIGGTTQSSDYPTRTLLGADYVLNRMITAFAQQELTFGDNADTSSTRLGLQATPWDGFQARTSVEKEMTEQSRRLMANLGLIQSWQINPYWSTDVSLDRSQTLSGEVETAISPDVPPASGSSDDFTAVSIGTNLRKQLWMWDNRVEFRTSDAEDRWALHSGYTIEPRSGLGLSLGLFLIQENRDQAGNRTSGDLRFGFALRPLSGQKIILNRLDLITDHDSGAADIDSWQIINRLKGFWRLSQKLHLSLQYGSKYTEETINTLHLSEYIDSPGGELRYDLNPKWDIGLHASALHQWEGGQISYSSGTSVGYSPGKNFWLSLGYNFSGYSDEDLSSSNNTVKGAFFKFRFKFDQNSVKDALASLDRS